MMLTAISEKRSLNPSRVIFAVIATAYLSYYVVTLTEWHFIDNVNLLFHEGGHVIFMPFGEFVQISGGTLMQLLIPILCSLSFLRKSDYYSASMMLFWLSQNLFNVSVYAGDAVRMELPLLGGDNVIHDWNYLLSSLSMLGYTGQVALAITLAGFAVFAAAVVLSFTFSFRENDTMRR
ncbi:MAG: hypothetical protein WCL23_01030 [Candidatus Moraniibacteriota bacterium]